jgi:hypothetical protein
MNMIPANFAEALVSQTRSPDIHPDLDIYASLLGNWKLRLIDYDLDGRVIRDQTGIWYFSRTLEGRAVQDVLVTPDFIGRSDNALMTGNRYGSTIRIIDPKTQRWKINWFNPVSGVFNELFARLEGNNIIQESAEHGGHIMRWIFENITANSFHWYGETSDDHGKTWILRAEFFAAR